ncbi:MAG TPA: hypothetical protein VFF56_03715 [Bacillota bacterium]|jgi:hypothetical protein|nr:hypothetical protein [Bacillota bacterium]
MLLLSRHIRPFSMGAAQRQRSEWVKEGGSTVWKYTSMKRADESDIIHLVTAKAKNYTDPARFACAAIFY